MYEKTPIKLHVNKITQRIPLSLPHENSVLSNFSADTCLGLGCEEVVYSMSVSISGAGPHINNFAYEIVRIHTLMICSNFFQYNSVSDTKVALSRCIPFISDALRLFFTVKTLMESIATQHAISKCYQHFISNQ